MLKRLTVALAALAIGLLPLTTAMADEHEPPAAEPTLSEVVAAAVAAYLVGLDLSPGVAAEIGATLGDLVQALADAAADEVAEPVVFEDDDEEGDEEQEAAAEFEEQLEEESVEDDTHGEVVSMVAQCAPRGKLLKGTGVNHGTFVSAVASGNPVVVPAVVEGEVDLEGGEEFTVQTVEDAEWLCEALEAFADDLTAAQSSDDEVDAASSGDQKAAKGNKGKGAKKDR